MPESRPLNVKVRIDADAPPGDVVTALARLLRRLRDRQRGGASLSNGERSGDEVSVDEKWKEK